MRGRRYFSSLAFYLNLRYELELRLREAERELEDADRELYDAQSEIRELQGNLRRVVERYSMEQYYRETETRELQEEIEELEARISDLIRGTGSAGGGDAAIWGVNAVFGAVGPAIAPLAANEDEEGAEADDPRYAQNLGQRMAEAAQDVDHRHGESHSGGDSD